MQGGASQCNGGTAGVPDQVKPIPAPRLGSVQDPGYFEVEE